MIVSDIISITLLAILLFWTLYNGSIIYVGIRNKHKRTTFLSDKSVELPKISLIVPTKNEETVIRRCLEGILNIDYPISKMQIIVVDGKSDDNTYKILQYPTLMANWWVFLMLIVYPRKMYWRKLLFTSKMKN
jgi:biofilm PGA synthesis N-glycosyltransferase PgaC